jgi:hypothetical protein
MWAGPGPAGKNGVTWGELARLCRLRAKDIEVENAEFTDT